MLGFASAPIEEASYDFATLNLRVRFCGRDACDHFGVPPLVYLGLCLCPSKGIYYELLIRGRYIETPVSHDDVFW